MPRDIALALSGGGCRAAFFHLGVLKQLHALGLADRLGVVSSVSGGSIVSAAYAHWLLHGGGDFGGFERRVTGFLERHLDRAVFRDFYPGPTSSEWLERAYDSLCSDAGGRVTMTSDLGQLAGIVFVFNATANHSGRGWRFVSGGVAEEWELGQTHGAAFSVRIDRYGCDLPLGRAVAASAAFPTFAAVRLSRNSVTRLAGGPPTNFYQDLPETIHLSDGGIRDNSGLTSILAGQSPTGFEGDYYLIASDAGFFLSHLLKPLSGRLRKVAYLLRSFDTSHFHNSKLATYLALTLHRRGSPGKGAAMLRMDEAVLEGGEAAIDIAQLAQFETRLRPLNPIIAQRLIGHGSTILHARLTEYTDLLSPVQQLPGVVKQRAKDE